MTILKADGGGQNLNNSCRSLSRSRSPHSTRCTPCFLGEDVLLAHALRCNYSAPKQSKFRVASALRFVRTDGSEGVIKAVNAEPHDANIRGAICAERAALCEFQRLEADKGARITRVVCVTDASQPIFPGPLCREFLTSLCNADVEIVASGSDDQSTHIVQTLRDLFPLPSIYCNLDQDAIMELGRVLFSKVTRPVDEALAACYLAAFAHAKRQEKQASVFPVLFAAAVHFTDGRVHTVAELKGIEYGCTVDAVSLLIPELQRSRDADGQVATHILQVDHFGVAHAPFAAARTLLIEHGFGHVLTSAHALDGSWATAMSARDTMPFCSFMEMW